MSNVAILYSERPSERPSERSAPGPADEYLGPARVIASGVRGVEVDLPGGGPVVAQPALAFPYEPAVDDVVLVIGKGGVHYVIGVLQGSGKATLAIHGDVELRAVGGSLTLAGDKGLRLEGPEVEVSTGKLRVVADALVEKLTTAYRHVRGLMSVRAGETHTLVEETSFAKAKNGVIVTDEKMAINGKEIHLG